MASNGWRCLSFQIPEEQFQRFFEKVKGDTSLQKKLKATSDADAVVAIAKAAGFVISADDLKKSQTDVSEEELEGVAGGYLGRGNTKIKVCKNCQRISAEWH